MREVFPTQVCIHSHEIPHPPKDQRLPLFVIASRRLQVVVIEGMPEAEELLKILSSLIAGKKLGGPASRPPGPEEAAARARGPGPGDGRIRER